MAFWKPHADPVSWWSCRYWLLRINTARPCGECRRCWKQCELCSLLSGSWEQSTCERMIFMLRPSNEMIFHLPSCDHISVDNLWVEVFNACFLDWFLCVPYLALVFWNLQVPWMCDFAVLPYVKSSVPQLKKCSPSLEAVNMVLLFMYYAYYVSQTQRLGSCFWRRPDGSLCVWMSSVPSLPLLLPLGPWSW